MMLNRVIFLISSIFITSFGYETKIEWSLGSDLPVTKFLDSGTVQDLYCSVEIDKKIFPIILLCPLKVGLCLRDCNTTKDISCTVISNRGKIIYQYRFKVFKHFQGPWRCQYGTKSSRSLDLAVTDKPYINSLSMSPNPVWKGSLMNITCQVMPISGIISIQFQRVLDDNSTVTMTDAVSYKIDQWNEGIIINSATPGVDDRIQCTVYTANGIITTKLLKTNIFYFPKNITLTSSAPPEKRHEIGSLISFQCSATGGNPVPIINVFHERFNESPKKLLDKSIILTKQDNNAKFFCELEKIAGRMSSLKSNTIVLKVNYPPEKLQLTEDPDYQLVESQSKQFVCLLKGSSEPPSHIEWSIVDSLGRKVQKHNISTILEPDPSEKEFKTDILKSTVRMVLLKAYNGYSVTCSIIYQGRRVLSQTKIITVVFAPNHIALNPNPLGPIPEGQKVVLTCFTGAANPQPKIQWYKTEPGKRTEDITSHSNLDMAPANYSGVSLSSTLNIHGSSRLNHATMYKCVVTHAYLPIEISKEYLLKILYPPVIQVFSIPKLVEEGDKVQLLCHTSGGNPANVLEYNFQWEFCPVNISYQSPSNTDMVNKPSSEIRQGCSRLSDNFAFYQSPVLNISSITYKDRGWYSCHIRSPGGMASGYSFLDVFYLPILSHQSPSRIYAKPGSNINLNVDLLSNPIKVVIKWYFRQNLRSFSKLYELENHNSKDIPLTYPIPGFKQLITMKPFGKIKYSLFENYTIQLSISSITSSDYGDYFCEVQNKLGKRSLEFQIYPSEDISVSESSTRLQYNGRTVTVYYEAPSPGHFSHLVLRICPLKETDIRCKDMQILNPGSGQATVTLPKSPNLFSYRLLVYNGSTLLQMTGPIQKDPSPRAWLNMPIDMMVGVIIGVVGILVLLFVTLLTLVFLKCRRKKPKDNFLENNSVATTNSQQRRQDYMLLNSAQSSSLLKNGCHCFSNYPLELRSDNGSDHSVPSQNICQPMMMRRKVRDSGEMSSVHSGGSCHSPDVVLTERTSINSSNNPMLNGMPYPYTLGNGSTKVTLLSGRLHPLDGQRQDGNMSEDFMMPQELIFSPVDDGMNISQARIIPIPKNLTADYPVYFQMNNSLTSKPYDMNQPSLYTSPIPQCQNRLECNNNQESRENSTSTNTDSNLDSATHNVCNMDSSKSSMKNIRNDN